jgi:hypothetical protein
VSDVWVRWGESAASKAAAVLHVRGAPATPQDIFAAIGAGPTTFKALREALYADPQFVRASRLTWGLRGWGLRAYSSIAEEMAARIDAAGGETTIDELIADLRSRFPRRHRKLHQNQSDQPGLHHRRHHGAAANRGRPLASRRAAVHFAGLSVRETTKYGLRSR